MRLARWLSFAVIVTSAVVCLPSPAIDAAIASRQQKTPPSVPTTREEVDALLREADNLSSSARKSEARPIFERALEAARRLALEPQEASALCGLSETFIESGKYPEARETGLQCLALFERLAVPAGIGRANLVLSTQAELSGDYTEAAARARRGIAAYETPANPRGRALATLQLIRNDKGADRPALFARALDDALKAGDRAVEAHALHLWGDVQFDARQYEDALSSLERAAARYRELDRRVDLGTVFNSLGRLYRAHGRLDEALQFQLKALALHETSDAPFALMQSLNAVAAVNAMLDRTATARSYYERALTIAETSSSPRIQDTLRANLAGQWINEGEFERGAAALEQVIAHGVDQFLSLRHGQLSLAYFKLGRFEPALTEAEQSLKLCREGSIDCVHALRHRAAARAAMGQSSAAVTDIDGALGLLEGIRKNLVPTDYFRQDFQSTQQSIYSGAIALKLGLNQPSAALETAELARARAFIDLLATRDVQLTERDPNGLTASPASSAALAAVAERLRSTLVLYWVAENELFIWVVGPNGRTHAERVSMLRSKLTELIGSTSPFSDSAPTAAATTKAAVVTRGTRAIETQTLRPAAWRELYDVLIKPIRNALPSTPGALITIVPAGPLLNLSFAALQNERGRYLLEDYTLHYAPAGAVLQFTEPKRRLDARTSDVLLVADPVPPVLSRLDRPLARLPGARMETTAIAQLFPRRRLSELADAAATESGVRAAAEGRGVIHLATHAIVRDDDPFGSFLALAPAASTKGDGILTAQEIYGWNLRADLVVLSACRSASGRVTGDGIATFARAFIYAGTASLIASLWDVADEPTNRLLPDFYRSWLGGQSKARALRTAQLQLLRDLRAGRIQLRTAAGVVTLPEHPVFWAGFALIGEPE